MFFIGAGRIQFFLRLNIFTSKISNLPLPLGTEEAGGCELRWAVLI